MMLLSLSLTSLFLLSSCESYSWERPEVPQDMEVSFSQSIAPFCHGCHPTWNEQRVYDKLSGNVSRDNPATSKVLTIHSSITAFGSQMLDVDGTLLPATEIIKLWVTQGAEQN